MGNNYVISKNYLTATIKLVTMALIGVSSISAHAVEEAGSDMEQVLVTGTYSPVPASDMTSSVTVLGPWEIRALNKSSVADVLKTIPGILVEEQGGAGGLTAISIRGGETNFTLVMIDGVPMNDPTNTRGGGFDVSNLNLASIERIEVIRGPQSAIYGSDALAGVINIITRRAQQGHHQFLRLERGSENFHNYSAGAMGKAKNVGYALNLSQRDGGDGVEGSSRTNDEANASIDWQPAENHTFRVSYRYLDGSRTSYPEQSGGPQFALIDHLDESDYTDRTLAAKWRADFSTAWQSTLNINRFNHDESYTSPGIFPFFAVPPNGAETSFRRDQVQWINKLVLDESFAVSLGGDYRHEEGESTGYLDLGYVSVPTDFVLDRNTSALFGDIHLKLGQQLLLQGSVRYDKPDDYAGNTSLNMGARYEFEPEVSIFVNFGEGFKLPSFFALGHPLLGNPDLRPETAQSWDTGVRWAAGDKLNLSATYFFNDYQDLIDFDPVRFRLVNRKQVTTKGVELQTGWSLAANMVISAHSTYTSIDTGNDPTTLLGRPEWRVGASAMWRLDSGWSTTLDYQWTGKQYAASQHTGETKVELLDDFHRIDWNLAWQASEKVRFELAIDNLLDEHYYTGVGFPAPGRTLRLAFSLADSPPPSF